MNRSDDVTISGYETATFYCMAVSDDSTVIKYSWYFGHSSQPLVVDNRSHHFGDTRLSVDTQFDDDGGAGRAGMYRCVADNGYSSDAADFQLTVTNGRFIVT